MNIVILILTIIGIVAAVVFGFLQVIVPFVKREVRLSKRFPFVVSLEAKDAFYGIPCVLDLAYIYTIVDEFDAALDQLEYLLSIPSWLSASWIAIDPRWDRLRDHPRFQGLTK